MAALHKLIEEYNLQEYCMVQSFDHETVREFEYLNATKFNQQTKISAIYLHSFEVEIPLLDPVEVIASPNEQGQGGHFQLPHVTPHLVE